MARSVSVTFRVATGPGDVASGAAGMFASTLAAAVRDRGIARVAISGGSTPKAMFALLADRGAPYFAQVPWDRLHLFWVDERCVPPTDADSNYRMTNEAMLSRVPLPAAQIHRMEGELDPEIAATRYESVIREAFALHGGQTPVFDLVLLGMGDDGHTASLFPHTAALHETQRLVVANHVPQKDTWRITLTSAVINHGREVAFLIEGMGKAQVVHDVFQGAYDPESKPSQLVRPENGSLTVWLDTAAAAQLPLSATGGKLEISG